MAEYKKGKTTTATLDTVPWQGRDTDYFLSRKGFFKSNLMAIQAPKSIARTARMRLEPLRKVFSIWLMFVLIWSICRGIKPHLSGSSDSFRSLMALM